MSNRIGKYLEGKCLFLFPVWNLVWNKHLQLTHFSNIQKSLTNNELMLFISFFEMTQSVICIPRCVAFLKTPKGICMWVHLTFNSTTNGNVSKDFNLKQLGVQSC